MDSAATIGIHAVIFVAAMFQTATGIGFALIAGPFLLMYLQDGSAIQISVLLNLLMSVVLAPTLIKHVHWPSLRHLALGLAGGLPVGLALFVWADLTVLKLGAAVFVSLALMPFLRPPAVQRIGDRFRSGVASGVVAGAMTGFAAMPGPAASYYLTGLQNLPRDIARSTIYAYFVLAYGAALILHTTLTGVVDKTLVTSALFMPAAAAGMLAGIPLARRLSQKWFRLAVAGTLLLTAVTLVAAVLAEGHRSNHDVAGLNRSELLQRRSGREDSNDGVGKPCYGSELLQHAVGRKAIGGLQAKGVARDDDKHTVTSGFYRCRDHYLGLACAGRHDNERAVHSGGPMGSYCMQGAGLREPQAWR